MIVYVLMDELGYGEREFIGVFAKLADAQAYVDAIGDWKVEWTAASDEQGARWKRGTYVVRRETMQVATLDVVTGLIAALSVQEAAGQLSVNKQAALRSLEDAQISLEIDTQPDDDDDA